MQRSQPEDSGFHGVVNFRDGGGYDTTTGGRMRSGVLYRAGHFGNATDDDVGLLSELGVGTFVDFRTDLDIGRDGVDRMPSGARHVHAPMGDPMDLGSVFADRQQFLELFGDGQGHEEMARRTALAATERAAGFGVMVDAVLEADGAPFVIHCTAGKDRTGFGVALLQRMCGLDEVTMLRDYLLSNAGRAEVNRRRLAELPEDMRHGMLPFMEVREA